MGIWSAWESSATLHPSGATERGGQTGRGGSWGWRTCPSGRLVPAPWSAGSVMRSAMATVPARQRARPAANRQQTVKRSGSRPSSGPDRIGGVTSLPDKG